MYREHNTKRFHFSNTFSRSSRFNLSSWFLRLFFSADWNLFIKGWWVQNVQNMRPGVSAFVFTALIIKFTHMLRIQDNKFFLFVIFLTDAPFCLNATDLQLGGVLSIKPSCESTGPSMISASVIMVWLLYRSPLWIKSLTNLHSTLKLTEFTLQAMIARTMGKLNQNTVIHSDMICMINVFSNIIVLNWYNWKVCVKTLETTWGSVNSPGTSSCLFIWSSGRPSSHPPPSISS